MKINIGADISIVLTDSDRGKILAAAHPSKYSTRQLLERLIVMYNDNLVTDLQNVIRLLDEGNETVGDAEPKA